MNIVITREKAPSVPLQVSLSFLYASLPRTIDLFSATMDSYTCSKTLYRKNSTAFILICMASVTC